MSKKVEYIVKANIHGFKSGHKVKIAVDDNGTPLDKLWRRRLKDSKIDGCIVLSEEKKQSKPKQSAKEDS